MSQRVTCSVIGDGAVGKTCLLIQYAKNEFHEMYTPTIFDNYSLQVPVNGKNIEFRLKDTAGNETHDALRNEVCRDTDVYLMCYSIENRSSFSNLQDRWYKDIRSISPSAKMVLVGTKCDLEAARKVPKANGEALAQQWGIRFIECSAKKRVKVHDVFNTALGEVLFKKSKNNCILL